MTEIAQLPAPSRVAPPVRPRRRAPGLSLGRVLGIEISLDASWLIIAALLVFSLSGYFAGKYPALPPVWHWTAAAAATLVFFASILLHELSHSLVANARGIGVHGITLFIFGGVSRLKREPGRAADEFLMAIVGPLTSLVLGAVFLLGGLLLPAGSLVAAAVAWLGYINIALAVFNLLPGYPLDGGRVFRAVVWGVTGNAKATTAAATLAGQAIAYGFIILGVLIAFGLGALLNGIWLAFIGWFLLSAAQASRAQADIREVLGRLSVAQAMRTSCARVAPETAVAALVEERVLRTGERCFLVAEGTVLLGLVTLQEIRTVSREVRLQTTVAQIMVPLDQISSISASDSLLHALETMDEAGVNQLPVLQERELVGVLTREDLLHLLTVHLTLR